MVERDAAKRRRTSSSLFVRPPGFTKVALRFVFGKAIMKPRCVAIALVAMGAGERAEVATADLPLNGNDSIVGDLPASFPAIRQH